MQIFNEHYNHIGGKATMQVYSANSSDECSDSDDEEPKPKRKKVNCAKPFILALCTPLMARVHKNVLQSAELIFCDSTSSLDRFNVSLFILSTAHPAGGLPIGLVMKRKVLSKRVSKV